MSVPKPGASHHRREPAPRDADVRRTLPGSEWARQSQVRRTTDANLRRTRDVDVRRTLLELE
jgi:hypothetical protein